MFKKLTNKQLVEERVNKLEKASEKYQEKLKDIKKQIVPFKQYYKESFEKLKSNFPLVPDEHEIVITTVNKTHKFYYNDDESFKRDHKFFTSAWKEENFIYKDNLEIKCQHIVSIDFTIGKHISEYTAEEIEKWAKEKLDEEIMENLQIVEPMSKHYYWDDRDYKVYDLRV
jgi:hypothetical protein